MSGAALAPDPLFPRRDELLDDAALRARLSSLLGVEVETYRRVRATYHPGRSLRVLLAVRAGGTTLRLSARMFAPGTSGSRFERAGDGALHDAELATVFTVFPHDRKLHALPRLVQGPSPQIPGAGRASLRLVAHAPEKAATLAAVDADGEVVAFVKLYGDERAARTVRVHRSLAALRVRVPAVLAHWPDVPAVAFDAVVGAPARDEAGSHAVGAALAHLHRVGPLDRRRLARFDVDVLDAAAATIAAARPDVAETAFALARALRRTAPDDHGQPVCLHGDVHPKNVLVGGGAASFVDLDDVAAGPAAADLGSALAGLRYGTLVGRQAASSEALCNGYGDVRPLPPVHALRWHTAAALLGERAVRAITRLRPAGLARLDAVLGAGLEELG